MSMDNSKKTGDAWKEYIEQFPKLKELFDTIPEATRTLFSQQIDIFAGKYPVPKQPEAVRENGSETDEPIHLWFELSYAQYLTIPRSIMEAMPIEWQRKMAALLDELDEAYKWRPQEGRYWVRLKDGNGRYVSDPLMEYRHPNKQHIQSLMISEQNDERSVATQAASSTDDDTIKI